MRPPLQLALPFAAFTAITLLTQLAGATNLGTAAAFGQMAFIAMAAFVLLRT